MSQVKLNVESLNKLLEFVKARFRPILPNTPAPLPLNFTKADILQLIKLIQVFSQLVIQNVLLSGGEYSQFTLNCATELAEQEGLAAAEHKVDIKKLAPYFGVVRLRQQKGLWQEPLLAAFKSVAVKPDSKSKEQILLELQKMVPLVDSRFLPCFQTKPTRPRCRFSKLEDSLLLIGVSQHSPKNLELIRDIYLPTKTEEQIKHRFKNLSCKKAQDCPIKQWRIKGGSQLNSVEQALLAEAVARHGENRFGLISRYYLRGRPDYMLEQQWRNSLPSKMAVVGSSSEDREGLRLQRYKYYNGVVFEYDSL